MDHPFYTNNWAAPLRHRYHPHPPAALASAVAPPKVVSIPVHFVGSEAGRRPIDPSAAAVRIQRAVRGFLVRKNMRTVRKIAAEAEAIARWIEASAEEIRRDGRESRRERLRVGEMLMALLLRLDSVRGVRDYRKAVIRRVIQLQEAVDSVTTANTNEEAAEATMMEESKAGEAGEDPMDEVPECDWPEEKEEAAMEEPRNAEAEGPRGLKSAVEELVGLKEVLERTARENEGLKGMVAVLCERSAQQCRLMNGLVQRVEQLERRMQSMERKKKKSQAAAATNHALAPKKKE